MIGKVERLLQAGTAVIADVFDSLGRLPLVFATDLRSIRGTGIGFAGPAYTIGGQSHQWSSGGDRAKLAAIDDMPQGVVAVWAGGDIRGVCCFGDLLASAMQARGCIGAVVDGGVRDLAFLRECSLAVVARYWTPAQAIGRWRVTSSKVAVQVRGALEDTITIHPGDIIVADDDGVVAIPQELLDSIFDKVIGWAGAELGARKDIQNGLPLLRALDKYGHL